MCYRLEVMGTKVPEAKVLKLVNQAKKGFKARRWAGHVLVHWPGHLPLLTRLTFCGFGVNFITEICKRKC